MLFRSYDIKTPYASLRERSSRAEFEKAAESVQEGDSIAYVTDAGTPGISDPGNLLVSLVRANCGEACVVPIPGPSALTAAVSVTGLSMDEFIFLGFLPHKKGRQTALNSIATEKRPVIVYESPHRILKLFTELEKRIPERKAIVFRELTKLHEQIAFGTVAQILARIQKKDIPALGEFVVAIAR